MGIRKTTKEIIILVGVSVAMAVVVNYFSPTGIALVGQWNIAKGLITASPSEFLDEGPHQIDNIARARELFNSGEVLFVDARSQADYEDGHIPEAVSLPIGRFDERIESFLKRYPPDQPIVTYCSGRTCEDSHSLARFLLGAGYTDVRIFINGFTDWQAEGHPIE
jgi:rhodanese-related sulfurtransferase